MLFRNYTVNSWLPSKGAQKMSLIQCNVVIFGFVCNKDLSCYKSKS